MTPRKKPAPDAPPAPPVALRVRAIRLQLDAGTWGPGCAAELAATWGVTEVVVRAHAAEAQRQREAVLDAGAAAKQIEADIAIGIQMAMEAGDLNALKGLLEARLKLHGIGAHKRPEAGPQVHQQPAPGAAPAEVPFWLRPKASKEGDPS